MGSGLAGITTQLMHKQREDKTGRKKKSPYRVRNVFTSDLFLSCTRLNHGWLAPCIAVQHEQGPRASLEIPAHVFKRSRKGFPALPRSVASSTTRHSLDDITIICRGVLVFSNNARSPSVQAINLSSTLIRRFAKRSQYPSAYCSHLSTLASLFLIFCFIYLISLYRVQRSS